jgi:hypothetical protein
MASLQQPLALWTTKGEREKYDAFADLYALIKTVDKLEKARTHAQLHGCLPAWCLGTPCALPAATRC